MVKQVRGARLFHVTRAIHYNSHPAMRVGSFLTSGLSHNPFFGFFEKPLIATVTLPGGANRAEPILRFLRDVRVGEQQTADPFGAALQTAEHLQKLVRELQMEISRLEISPASPSRQTCLWCVETLSEAKAWLNELGGSGRILELSATGTITVVDAAWLPTEVPTLSEFALAGASYWRGELSPSPQLEVLFSGTATVVAIHPLSQ